jgi:uncharacterized protein YkuJ
MDDFEKDSEYQKKFSQCELGNLESCSSLFDLDLLRRLMPIKETSATNTYVDALSNRYKKMGEKVCPIALEQIEEQFEERVIEAEEYKRKITLDARDGMMVSPSYAKENIREKGKDEYSNHVDTIENACLDFPLTDCIYSEEIDKFNKLTNKPISKRRDHEDLRGCAVVLPQQDSQLMFFGKSNKDSLMANKNSPTQPNRWKDFLQDKPAMLRQTDKYWRSMSEAARDNLEEKLGNTLMTLENQMVLVDCIHPFVKYTTKDGEEKTRFTRYDNPEQLQGGLRELGIKMPARLRLKGLKAQIFSWWATEFSRMAMGDWDYFDIDNLYDAARNINEQFPSERTMVDDFLEQTQNIPDKYWARMNYDLKVEYFGPIHVEIYYDREKELIHYVYLYTKMNPEHHLNSRGDWEICSGTIEEQSVYDEFRRMRMAGTSRFASSVKELLKAAIVAKPDQTVIFDKTEKCEILTNFDEYMGVDAEMVYEYLLYSRQMELCGNSRYKQILKEDFEKVMHKALREQKERESDAELIAIDIYDLMDTFELTRENAGAIFRATEQVREGIRSLGLSGGGGGLLDTNMKYFSKLIDGYGVEPLHISTAYINSYFGDIVAMYVNMGDPYVPTIIFDTEFQTFHIMGAEDYIRYWEIYRQDDDDENFSDVADPNYDY